MPAPLRDMPQEGIELIKAFEGIPDGDPTTVNLDAYLDPLGIWTIGWGHAVLSQGRMVRGAANKALARALYPGGITVAQAEALLRGDLVTRAGDVQRLVRVPLSDWQYAALMSFVFNCGAANFASSTLLKQLNLRNYAAAADQFLVWNKGRDKNGVLVELPGLTRRRKAERALFLGENWRVVAGVPAVARRAGPPAAGARRKRHPPAEVPVRPSARAQNAALVAAREAVAAPARKRRAKPAAAKKRKA